MTKIPGDVARNLYDAADGETLDSGHKRIEDVDMGSGRWDEHHWLVFIDPHDDRPHAFSYSMGLTEYQDHEFPWSDSGDYGRGDDTLIDVDTFEVVPQERVITEWRVRK